MPTIQDDETPTGRQMNRRFAEVVLRVLNDPSAVFPQVFPKSVETRSMPK